MTRLARFVSAIAVVSLVACGPSKRNNGDDGDDTADAAPPDLYCPTSISGKVFAPNGTLPLYNVSVYAPTMDPPPFEAGVQCGQCTSQYPGGAYAATQSDPEGKFKLEGLPIGFNIPVIVTTGKWRRKFVVPEVKACVDTPIPDGQFRLPKNRTEGEMPRIAVVDGGCDELACVLAKLGVETAEFGSSSAANTPVVFFNGVGGNASGAQSSTVLHGDLNELKKFDVVINSCECDEHQENKTGTVNADLLRQYADLGGRVLGSHYHYTWMKDLIPQWQGTATYWGNSPRPPAAAATGPDIVDMSHPGGMAMARWLMATGASSALGQITLGDTKDHAQGAAAGTTRWLRATGVVGVQPITHYLSFNTPVGLMPENQCGKVVYAGMHVANGSFPSCASGTFSPDEKAFAYLIFDLTTCINPLE